MIDNHAWPDGKPDWATGICGRILRPGWFHVDGGRWLVVERLWPDRGRVTVCTADNPMIEAY